MKFHRPIAEQVVSAIKSIFGATPDGRRYYADKVIERLFKNNRKLGARDRRFVAETVYGIVRWWRLLTSAVGANDPLATPDEPTIWRVLGSWLIKNGQELPSWREFADLDPEQLARAFERLNQNPAVRESVPDWLYQLGLEELGTARWQACLVGLNEQAPVVLRTNRLKTTVDELQVELEREAIATELLPGLPDGLLLKERKNVFTSESFRLGHFEVQDGASQFVAPLLRVEPGQRVIDGCAGAGGKTLHLAALMRNKGKIIALDVHQGKLDELRKRSSRGGCDIIETRLIDSNKTVKRMAKTADRVLLDVPCSGLGVLRRNPDSKWKLEPSDIPRLRALQAEILESYSEMLKPGGRLVYATCSILPSENLRQVEAFLSRHATDWRLCEAHQFWPGIHRPAESPESPTNARVEDHYGFDGFFAAALERLK